MTDRYQGKEITLSELLTKAAAGDAAAFEEAVRRTEKNVYNYALSLTQNPADAEDVVQETYLKLWRSLSSFRGGSAEGWVLCIVRNSALDLLRRRRPDLPLTAEDENGEEKPLELPDPDPDCMPDAEYLRRLEIRTVREEIARLPRGMREILVMRDMNGLSYEEISSALGIGLGTVKSRIFRARNMLGKFLKERNIL